MNMLILKEKGGSARGEEREQRSWVVLSPQDSQGSRPQMRSTTDGKSVNNGGPTPETMRNNQRLTGT